MTSSLLGFITALARLSKSAVAFGIASFYASFFRGTPLLIQILLIYLGLPQLGIVPGAIAAGIIALSLNYGAYLSEIFRAGILGVPPRPTRSIIGPGHARNRDLLARHPAPSHAHHHPANHQPIHLDAQRLVTDFGDGGVWEVMFLAQSYGRSSYRYIEMLTTAAIIYWLMSIGLELIQARMERHYGKAYLNRS